MFFDVVSHLTYLFSNLANYLVIVNRIKSHHHLSFSFGILHRPDLSINLLTISTSTSLLDAGFVTVGYLVW
jgi:hypothetical protein